MEEKSWRSGGRWSTMRHGSPATLAESNQELSDPMPRPRRAGVLYRRGDDDLWLVNYDGAQNRKLRLAAGGLGAALSAPDGRTVVYLNIPPPDGKELNNNRERTSDTNDHKPVFNDHQVR